MLSIRYCSLNSLDEESYARIWGRLPENLKPGIQRYRFLEDRKRRLAAREMVRAFLEKKGYSVRLETWTKGPQEKPYLPGMPYFNISHSGDWIVVVFSDQEVGIDIERISELDLEAVSRFFHPEEISLLEKEAYDKQLFFRVWARKEAYLKATGKGITGGLSGVSVLEGLIAGPVQPWYIEDVDRWPGYHCAVCTPYAHYNLEVAQHFFD